MPLLCGIARCGTLHVVTLAPWGQHVKVPHCKCQANCVSFIVFGSHTPSGHIICCDTQIDFKFVRGERRLGDFRKYSLQLDYSLDNNLQKFLQVSRKLFTFHF